MKRIANILNSEIPIGGFGRSLTSAECKKLRDAGISCSERWAVVRRNDSPTTGILYYPAASGGLTNAGVIVDD